MGNITKNLLVLAYHQHLTSQIDQKKLLYHVRIPIGKDRLLEKWDELQELNVSYIM